MDLVFQIVAFAGLCFSPVPSFSLLAKEAESASALYRWTLLTIYWICFLTAISLVLGFSGLFSMPFLAAAVFTAYAPLLSSKGRAECAVTVRKYYHDIIRFMSDNTAVGVAVAVLLTLLFYKVAAFTTDDFDSQAYHLPFVYHWLQDGRFAVHPQFDDCPIGYYPSNWEALCALPVMTFRSDLMMLLPNLSALVLFMLGIAGVGRHFGVGVNVSIASALMLCLAPIMAHNVLSLHVDLPMAAFFMSAISVGLNIRHIRGSSPYWAAGLSVAMLPGIKSSGAVYALLAVLIILIRRPIAFKSGLLYLKDKKGVAFAAAALLLSCSWYVRNIALYGTPLGISLDKEPVFRSTLMSVMRWSELWDYRVLGQTVVQELGILFPALTVLALVYLLLNRRVLVSGLRLGVLIAVTLLLFLVTPYSGDIGAFGWRVTIWVGQAYRYGFVCLGFISLAVALAFGQSAVLSRLLVICALLFCICEAMLMPVPGIPILAAGYLMYALGKRALLSAFLRRHGMPAAALTALGILLALTVSLATLGFKRAESRPRFARDIYDQLACRSVTNLTYIRSHKGFMWYGEGLDVSVSFTRSRDVEGIVSFMRERGSGALGFGPSTIFSPDVMNVYSNILNDRRFRLICGELNAESPVLFEFRE